MKSYQKFINIVSAVPDIFKFNARAMYNKIHKRLDLHRNTKSFELNKRRDGYKKI